MEAEARKRREAELHDQMFSDGARKAVSSKYYAITAESDESYRRTLLANCRGDVLEYGVGLKSQAFLLADSGAATVTGIDISPVAIAETRDRVAGGPHADRLRFEVMDAESLGFPDDSFDLICGTGILHHLDLERAFSELSRVLRPGGVAVFVEPLAHNPLINLYRRRTPNIRTPDEHPLTMADLESARGAFGEVSTRFFHLQTLAAIPLRNSRHFERVLNALAASDRVLLERVPPLRRYAWQVQLELRSPRR